MSLGASSARVARANLYSSLGDKVDSIKELKANRLKEEETDADGRFDYYVSDEAYDYLSQRGIPLSLHCHRVHPHPISKMIENHILFNVFRNLSRHRNCFISIKESKLVSSCLNKDKFTRLDKVNNVYNRLVHAKDALRYTNPIRQLDLSNCETLKIQIKDAEMIFVHDEVHYWSLTDMQEFLSLCNVPVVYSIIYPAEIHWGYKQSLNPMLYKFHLDGSGAHFTWAPDGSQAGSYVQPVNPWLLSTSKTVSADGRTWTISKMESIGAHHVFIAVPGSLVTESEYAYTDYTILCPKRFGSVVNPRPEIRAELVRKTAHYLMALKKPDAASAVSKLRQLTKADETAEEILFVGTLAGTVSSTKYFGSDGLFRVGRAIAKAIKRCCGRWATYVVDKGEFDKWTLETYLHALKPPVITITRQFREYRAPDYKNRLVEVPEAMDSAFGAPQGGIQAKYAVVIPDRVPAPYSTGPIANSRIKCIGTELRRLEVYMRALLSCEVPQAYRSRTYYCKGVPLGLFKKSYFTVAEDLYKTNLLLCTKRPVDLLKEGLIDLEEYKRRTGPTPTKTESAGTTETSSEPETSMGDADGESDVNWEDSANQFKGFANTCLLGPVVRAMGVSEEVVLSVCNSVDPNFSRYLSKEGLTLCGFLKMIKILDLSVYMKRGQHAVSIKGSRKPIGVSITDGHAEECEYTEVGCDLNSLLCMSKAYGKATIQLNSVYAEKLKYSFEKSFTGVMLSDLKRTLREVEPFNMCVDVGTFLGFAGSGKSSTLVHALALTSRRCEVVVPRRALMEEWSKWLKNTPHAAYTLETYIIRGRTELETVILDEVSLFPPGYVDLIYSLKHPKRLLFLGDPLQTTYYSKEDELLLGDLPRNIFERLRAPTGIPYLFYSHRMPQSQSVFEVPCTGPGSYEVRIVNKVDYKKDTLTFKRFTDTYAKDFSCIMTVGQAQGLSRDEVQLILDDGARYCDDNTVITAISRSRGKLDLYFEVNRDELLRTAKSNVLKMLLKGKCVKRDYLESLLGARLGAHPKTIDAEEYIGSDKLAEMEERLRGDPYLKGMLVLLQEEEMEEEEMESEIAPERSVTHLPLTEHQNEIFPSTLGAKESREQYERGLGYTDQINNNFESERYAPPYSRSSVYLHHKSDDDLTFFLSIRKRLRFADYEKNKTEYEKKKSYGAQMFHVLKRKFLFPESPPVFSLSEKELEFTEKRLQKSAELLEAHNYRSDPDWPSNILKIFIKNQVCTKMEKRGADAKAGQTIACFSHAVLCKFGAQLRKTEEEFRSLLPDNILIFSQKNYDDLDQWCKTYFNSFCGTDSDYEAFDRSQDGMVLGMEEEMLRYFCWPTELIEEYKELKLMMGSSLGDLAVMRFSGEFGTFFFNTVCNMAYTYMRYEIPSSHPVAFAGDDMVSPGILPLSAVHADIMSRLRLTAKVNYGDKPLFCGWRVSPLGIVKDPNLLLDRWGIAEEKNKLHECMCNYALEASYGYRLSDSLFELNIDIDAYQELIRKIILIKRKLPEQIRRIFSSDPDVDSEGDGDP
uniref:RdRp n=1 Tax=Agave tequilana vitivirus 1 TaxID=2794429 RepID=A0A7T5QZ92_9VIRU|nr:RdRp [Agave tequilana vitivirus 1]